MAVVNDPDVGVKGQRVVPLGVTADGRPRYILVDDDGKVILAAGVSVDIGDINIGSVAIKDGVGDTLAVVKVGNTALPADDALLVADATAASILTLIKAAVQGTLDVALDISGDVPVPDQSLPPSSQGLIAWISKGQGEFLANSPTQTLGDATSARRVVIYDPAGNEMAIVSGGIVVNTLPLNPLVDGVTAVIDGAGSTELPVADADAAALLTAIDGHVDGVETLLTAVDGHVDGLEAATGTTTDAAVTTDAPGSHSSFLRGIVTILGAVTVSPVSNSIGDRLKTIGTHLATLAGAVSGGVLQTAETATAVQLSNAFSTAYENSHQVKAAAGWLFGFSVRNKSLTTTLYVGVYNAASKTGTPIQRFRVDPDDETFIPWAGDLARYFSTGIFLQGLTTGDGTDTVDTSASLWFDAQYQ